MEKLNLKNMGFMFWKSKGLFFIASIALFLFSASMFSAQGIQNNKSKKVLGINTKKFATLSTPTPTIFPSVAPTIRPVLIARPTTTSLSTSNVTPTPTQAPVNNSSSSNSSNSNTSVSTPTPTQIIPTITPTPTLSPTPAGLNVQIGIDYAGQKSSDSYSFTINPNQTAWDAVIATLGMDNIQYTDYGGDMGKFITSFNGISAGGNQYYEFRINGVSSDVGVSSYVCKEGDKLDFVLTSF